MSVTYGIIIYKIKYSIIYDQSDLTPPFKPKIPLTDNVVLLNFTRGEQF